MPLLPPLKAMFDAQQGAPPMRTDQPPAALRGALHAMIDQGFLALMTPQPPVASERDVAIPVDGGTITLRIYRSAPPDVRLACHVNYHGGGFFLGTLEQNDGLCRRLARDIGCVVVSVDYRLAPEHRFPIAAEDSYAAYLWVAAQAEELNIDPTRLSVGGASAGGNLAAVVAQLARDRGGPTPVAQVLEIPVTDFTAARVLTFPREGITIGADKVYEPLYLRDAADARDPRASPLLADSLTNLPPALVLCAEYDQLQPEGEAYARRLADAGVVTEYETLAGQFHGSQNFDRLIPGEVTAYQARIVAFLRRAFDTTAGAPQS